MKFPWFKKKKVHPVEEHIVFLDRQIDLADRFAKCCKIALRSGQPVEILLSMDRVMCPSAVAYPDPYDHNRDTLLEWLGEFGCAQKLKFQLERESVLRIFAKQGNPYAKARVAELDAKSRKLSDL